MECLIIIRNGINETKYKKYKPIKLCNKALKSGKYLNN